MRAQLARTDRKVPRMDRDHLEGRRRARRELYIESKNDTGDYRRR